MNGNTIFTIEGNIGAGKSTFLNQVKDKYSNNPRILFLDEPVELWQSIRDKFGVSMLQKFYSDPKKYSFSFQMMAFVSRTAILRKALEENTNCIIVSERCAYTDKHIFASMLYADDMMEDVEFQIYNTWFDEFAIKQVNEVFMMSTTPEISHERVIKRSRTCEVIALDYLRKCGEYHHTFMKTLLQLDINFTIFDADNDIYNDPDIMTSWIATFDEKIQSYLT
jgi:deoxyadenosine/deoxycytidine kinase